MKDQPRQPTMSDLWIRLTVMQKRIDELQKDVRALTLEAQGHDDGLREIRSTIGELSNDFDDITDYICAPWYSRLLGIWKSRK